MDRSQRQGAGGRLAANTAARRERIKLCREDARTGTYFERLARRAAQLAPVELAGARNHRTGGTAAHRYYDISRAQRVVSPLLGMLVDTHLTRELRRDGCIRHRWAASRSRALTPVAGEVAHHAAAIFQRPAVWPPAQEHSQVTAPAG